MSDNVETLRRYHAQLNQGGELALELVHPDVEVRKRVSESVPILETAALVAPKLVSLKGEKKSARHWFDELSKQTGYKIDLWNDNPKDVFTFDLEKVPFWKAVDEIGKPDFADGILDGGPINVRSPQAHVGFDGAGKQEGILQDDAELAA